MCSNKYFWIMVIILNLLCINVYADTTVVTISSMQSGRDPLKLYNAMVLALALDKTVKEYGTYRIELSPAPMNTARGLEEMRKNTYSNLVVMTTFQNGLLDDSLDYARFPIDFGVTGYRIGFVSPEAKSKVASVTSLDELKAFTIGQGVGWADIEILRSNGFKVVEVSSFESSFKMIALNRIDLYLRGINELEPEYKSHTDVEGLDYDRSMAISYTLPRFFFSNVKNKVFLDRLTKGLLIAYNDGSLRALWIEQYGNALKFANLKNRKIFKLTTPNIDRIDFNYKQYYFDPKVD